MSLHFVFSYLGCSNKRMILGNEVEILNGGDSYLGQKKIDTQDDNHVFFKYDVIYHRKYSDLVFLNV